MFTTRSTFELTRPKLILYLFLALAFIEKVSGDPHKEFGCEFTDTNYSMIHDPEGTPIWSNVTMESISVDNFEDIKEPFKNFFSEPSLMNDLPMFTEFVKKCKQDFKNQKPWLLSKHFEKFFNNYDVPFEPSKQYDSDFLHKPGRRFQEPASYLIQELHTLVGKSALKERSPYIVSAYVDPIGVTFKPSMSYQIPENISYALSTRRFQDHLAAIINIESGDRTGYILIDPGYSNGIRIYSPFVAFVMKDGEAPHGEFVRRNKYSNGMTFVYGDENRNPFILVKHKHTNITMHSLYYVGKPYCSFKENTIKPMLLRPYHGLIRRNNLGEREGYIRFKIRPSARQFPKNLFLVNETSVPKTITPTNAFNASIAQRLSVPDAQRDIIVNQLISVQRSVFWDKQFLRLLTGLTEKFGLNREPEPLEGQEFDAQEPNPVNTKRL